MTLVAYGTALATAAPALRPVLGPMSAVSAPSDDLVVLRGIVASAEEGYAVLRTAASTLLPDLIAWPWSIIGFAH